MVSLPKRLPQLGPSASKIEAPASGAAAVSVHALASASASAYLLE